MSQIEPRELEKFILEDLKTRLQQDLRDHKIIREKDLECCVYYHLRQFLQKDPLWKVLVEKHSPRTRHYIDLLVLHNVKPEIAIELKWKRTHISKKDYKSLSLGLSELKLKKAYFITTAVPSDSIYSKLIETPMIQEIIVGLNLSPVDCMQWKLERKKIKDVC